LGVGLEEPERSVVGLGGTARLRALRGPLRRVLVLVDEVSLPSPKIIMWAKWPVKRHLAIISPVPSPVLVFRDVGGIVAVQWSSPLSNFARRASS
jgi:hypothetical protein